MAQKSGRKGKHAWIRQGKEEDMNWIIRAFMHPIFVLFIVTFVGVMLGKLKYKGFRLGVSGALFVGLIFGHFGFEVPHTYFIIFLALFVAAVGLLAARDIGAVVKRYGAKFIVMGFMVTSLAAIMIFLCVKLFGGTVDPRVVEGAFTGALTSSPGLGASLEAAPSAHIQELLTIGHSIAYPLGVISVILFAELVPILTKMNLDDEKKKFAQGIGKKEVAEGEKGGEFFSLAGFCLAVAFGSIIGSIPIPLGPLGHVSLGVTGGVLIGALIIGYFGHVGPIQTRMSPQFLSPLREMTLAFFLAVVGLEAGKGFVEVVTHGGAILIPIAIIISFFVMSVAFIIGRYVWHLDWIILVGATCGGMTSTPGLGAAIDATGIEDVGAGYGATYPFAIIGMVIFAKLLGLSV